MKRIVLFVALCPAALGRTIRVANDAPADFHTIQAAVDDANDGDTVLLAPGIYTGDGNRDIDFRGKAITVRSEAGPESCIIDCNGTSEDQHRGFLFRSGETADSVLQGLRIRNGYSDKGGAVFCEASSPTILNCTITHCTVYGDRSGWGAGIYCYESHALIRECTFSENIAETANYLAPVTGLGGGIYCAEGTVTIVDCVFRDNEEDWSGSIHCAKGSPRIRGCTILSQKGIFCTHSNARIEDCSITCSAYGIICQRDDAAIIEACVVHGGIRSGIESISTIRRCVIAGSGISLYASNATIENCTVTGSAGPGLALYSSQARCTVSNSIFWNNGPTCQIQIYKGNTLYTPICSISHSNIQGGQEAVCLGDGSILEWGSGNLDVDPCFVDSGHWEMDANSPPSPRPLRNAGGSPSLRIHGDYHLMSQAGRWDPNSESWIQDEVTSPCIDAGDPNSPIGYEPFPNGGIINMGAYGGTPEASKSYFGEPVCETIIAGDLNGDCRVDFRDLALLLSHWLQSGASAEE